MSNVKTGNCGLFYLITRNLRRLQKKKQGFIHSHSIYLTTVFYRNCHFSANCLYFINYTESPVPYGDSFTTALSIIAMWMLAYKYIEQWVVVVCSEYRIVRAIFLEIFLLHRHIVRCLCRYFYFRVF